ncbi:MAG: formylglycine-generating enzyme family protein [Kiritimatiellia bacterium]
MRTTKVRTWVWIGLAGCLALTAIAEDPVITGVVVRQRWPWSRLVDIDYVLRCDATQRVDIALSAQDGSVSLTLPMDSLSGDLYGVGPGSHRVVWDPLKSNCARDILTKFSVTLTPEPLPLYMIIDLRRKPGEAGQVEYLYAADATTNKYGSWEYNFVTNAGEVIQSVAWTGVTNEALYKTKTDKLVLRRVPAGSYGMGDNMDIAVNLTKSMYAGVFPLTSSQWNLIMHNTSATDARPRGVTYNDLRGATNGVPVIDWPTTGALVSSNSVVARVRSKTGFSGFDLPTSAQWEYLCRAGTTTPFNDGNSDAKYNYIGVMEYENNGNTNKYLNALGWYAYNSSATHPVGEKRPNAWGLYDMHGSKWEYCLNWHNVTSVFGGTDPTGLVSGTKRMLRGGNNDSPAWQCRSAHRSLIVPTGGYGCRLVITLP